MEVENEEKWHTTYTKTHLSRIARINIQNFLCQNHGITLSHIVFLPRFYNFVVACIWPSCQILMLLHNRTPHNITKSFCPEKHIDIKHPRLIHTYIILQLDIGNRNSSPLQIDHIIFSLHANPHSITSENVES